MKIRSLREKILIGACFAVVVLIVWSAGLVVAADDEIRHLGGLSEALSQNNEADQILNGEIGPAMVAVVAGRKFPPWEKSIMYTRISRTRIASGAMVKRRSDNELATLLTDSGKSSDLENNPYVKLTKDGGKNSYEAKLTARILKMSGRVKPQDVLAASLDVCGNDYWLATITAHNLLKEVTYTQRLHQQAMIGWDNSGVITISPTDIANKLIDLRPEGDPKFSDRMGPWYHSFGLFFVGGITSGTEAQLLADVENFTRMLHAGSPSDYGKERVNMWAGRLSQQLNAKVAANTTDAVAGKSRPEGPGASTRKGMWNFVLKDNCSKNVKAQIPGIKEDNPYIGGNTKRAITSAWDNRVMGGDSNVACGPVVIVSKSFSD
jgi:hypothetical protein